ncbi:Rieske 2Fe-2S domain-containing protein [Yinghuangia aomiensis]
MPYDGRSASGARRSSAGRPDPVLGHAGYEIEHAGVRLLIDPWFHPAFLASWFPFPDNRPLLASVAAGSYDLLYLSHEHEDHFDARTLGMLDRDAATVVVPRFRSKSLVRRVTQLGFRNVVALGHRESYEAADGFVLTMLLDTSHKEDSGLVVDLGGFRFLDLNDCNTPMSELPTDVDVLSAQYAGAMWYPNCYAYPDEVQRKKTAEIRGDLFDTLVRKVRLTGAAAYLPAAGPPCFLDPELERFNDRAATIFPVWDGPRRRLRGGVPGRGGGLAGAGGRADRGRGCRVGRSGARDVAGVPAGVPRGVTGTGGRRSGGVPRRGVRGGVRGGTGRLLRQADVVEQALPGRLPARRPAGRRRPHPGRYGLAQVGGALEEDPVDAGYTIHVPSRALRAIVDGRIGWEEALLSLRLSLHRDPDVFDLTLMSLLRYGNHPAQTMQMVRERAEAASGESIERCGYSFQRFCPHAGEDLALADIDGEVLECPRHHWKWDLRTGECVSGGTVPLRVDAAEHSGA